MKNKLPSIGWMENRNGTPDISELEVYVSRMNKCIRITAKNCSGVTLKGGITAPIDEFMNVLKAHFELAGYQIIKKDVSSGK